MRIYTVVERSGKPSKDTDRDVVLVKEGFCWPGLLFGPLWALAHRMWGVAVILAAAWVGVTMLPSLVPAGGTDLQWLAGLALLLLQGVLGNDALVSPVDCFNKCRGEGPFAADKQADFEGHM